MTKARRNGPQKRLAAKHRADAKTSGVVPDLAAAAEPLSIYAGNSAQVNEAREAFERADAWARDPEGRPYGTVLTEAKR
jgi:hypothetical protein